MPTVGTYWGREFAGFMAGMGYAVSWDIAYWVGTDEAPAKKTIGQEDSVFRSWIYENKKVVKAISEDKEFYDEPSSKEGWAHEYTNGTILIHRLKRDEWFIKAAAHFLLNKELNI